MVAQTTLLRLKKLNLRNYAAPSSSSSTSSPTPATTMTTPSEPISAPPILATPVSSSSSSTTGVASRRQGQSGMQLLGGFPAHLPLPPPMQKKEDEDRTPTGLEGKHSHILVIIKK